MFKFKKKKVDLKKIAQSHGQTHDIGRQLAKDWKTDSKTLKETEAPRETLSYQKPSSHEAGQAIHLLHPRPFHSTASGTQTPPPLS